MWPFTDRLPSVRFDECTCKCHKHNRPGDLCSERNLGERCCNICPICSKNIKPEYYAQHVKWCGADLNDD